MQKLLLFILLLFTISVRSQDGTERLNLVPPGYMSCTEITALADSLATAFPSICQKIVFGVSVGGYELAALKISDNVTEDEPEPEILFAAGIHGDEILGPEVMMLYARALCLGYGSDSAYTHLIDSREIWIYYMVNPDGRTAMSRFNNNNVDCNRDAGYMWNAEGNSPDAFSQPETRALRDCIWHVNPVVMSDFHSGYQMISYPWSYRGTATRDWQHIDHMAGIYSASAGYSPPLPYGQGFHMLYQTGGTIKDFTYGTLGNVAWSIEISTVKQPPSSQIGYFYDLNEPGMTSVIEEAGKGIEGIISDQATGLPVAANIFVNYFYPVRSKPNAGDFHKYVLPGTYTVTVTANGYEAMTLTGVAVPDSGSVKLEIQMVPGGGNHSDKVVASRIPVPDFHGFPSTAYTPGMLGPADATFYSLWANGWVILDMGDTVFNNPGDDLKIIEGDTLEEEFKCYGSYFCDSGWVLLGNGKGTSKFDLENAQGGPVSGIRYLKIVDNGTGDTTGIYQGFDLDAAEIISFPVLLETVVKSFITLYPNPASDFVCLKKEGQNYFYYRILSLKGEVLSSGIIESKDARINLKDLSPALYFMDIRTKEEIIVKQLIKN